MTIESMPDQTLCRLGSIFRIILNLSSLPISNMNIFLESFQRLSAAGNHRSKHFLGNLIHYTYSLFSSGPIPRLYPYNYQMKSGNNNLFSSLMEPPHFFLFFLYSPSQPTVGDSISNDPEISNKNQTQIQVSEQECRKQVRTKSDGPEKSSKESFQVPQNAQGRRIKKKLTNSIQASKGMHSQLKKKEKDVQFKQRQQTQNRNLGSNTLKVYFKQLRDTNSQTHRELNKIIQLYRLPLSVEKFIQQLNTNFPSRSTYISFDKVKHVCHSQRDDLACLGKILRISIYKFFMFRIFTVNTKSTRTTRKIRNQQVRHGRSLLSQLFG